MKETLIFSFFLILISSTLFTQEVVQDTFQKALTAYESNDFESALYAFSQLENEGIINANLFYNIGNCHFRLGNIGKAILYYKKTLKEKSNHEAAHRNLNYALTFTQDKQGTNSEDVVRSFWKKTYDSLSLNLLAVIVLILFAAIILLICIMIVRFRGREKTVPVFITSILLVFLIFFILLGTLKWQNYHHSSHAVLLAKSAIGYSGPSQEFVRVFTIHEGMIFQIERTENNWSLIKLENGLGGWIQANTYEKI